MPTRSDAENEDPVPQLLGDVVVHEEEGSHSHREECGRLQHLADAMQQSPKLARESLAL